MHITTTSLEYHQVRTTTNFSPLPPTKRDYLVKGRKCLKTAHTFSPTKTREERVHENETMGKKKMRRPRMCDYTTTCMSDITFSFVFLCHSLIFPSPLQETLVHSHIPTDGEKHQGWKKM
jgi:hypothetical protein